MSLLVQKYGGTSVGSIERIKQVAAKIIRAKRVGHDVVVVVSAMAGETNRLLGLAHEIAEIPDEREKDVLLASGEQVSVALLTLALKELGQPARSYLGHQVRIETDNAYGKARILSIDSTKIVQAINEGDVVVVAGFQGVDEDDNITTLGRGGSDTSAVALAAFLNAAACEIYTDVEGVFTADPGICPQARKLARISYDEMIELASIGAKVLEIRSVEFAKNFSVPVHVRSSFSDAEGTWLINEEESMSAGFGGADFRAHRRCAHRRRHDYTERQRGRHHRYDFYRAQGRPQKSAEHHGKNLAGGARQGHQSRHRDR